MLQERNQRSGNRGNLLRRYVNQVNIRWRDNREVSILTTLDNRTDKRTVFTQRSISLTNNVTFFFLCSQIDNILIVKIGNTLLYLTIWSLDETKFINLCIDTK